MLLAASAGKGKEAKPRHKAFPNTEAGFQRLAERLQSAVAETKVHACPEATGPYGDALARSLHAQGHTVSVVPPIKP